MCEAELNFAADAYVKRLNGDPLKYEPLVDESGGGAGGAPLPKPNGCAPRRLFAPLMRSWWLLLEAQQRSTFQLFRHHFITATVPAKGKGKDSPPWKTTPLPPGWGGGGAWTDMISRSYRYDIDIILR